MGKTLIFIGLGIVVLGLIVMASESLFRSTGGRPLPGDIYFRKGNFTFFFPIVTCLMISIILTLGAWLIQFLKK